MQRVQQPTGSQAGAVAKHMQQKLGTAGRLGQHSPTSRSPDQATATVLSPLYTERCTRTIALSCKRAPTLGCEHQGAQRRHARAGCRRRHRPPAPPASAVTAADSKAAHLPDLRQGHLHAPQLALVPQAELADQLELAVQPLLLEWPPRLLEGLAICGSARSGQLQQAACLHAATHVFHISSQRLVPKQLHQSR